MAIVISKFLKAVFTSANGSLAFNDAGTGDFNLPDLWPFYLVESAKGLRRGADLDDNTEANTEANGIRELRAYARSKIVTYAGKVYGQDMFELHAGINAFLLVFGPDPDSGEVLAPGRMVIDPDAAVSVPQTFLAVPRAVECEEDDPADEAEQPSRFHASFSVDLRLADARFHDWDGASPTNPKW